MAPRGVKVRTGWPMRAVVVAEILLLLLFLLPLLWLPGKTPPAPESPTPGATGSPTPDFVPPQPVAGWDAGQILRLLRTDGTVEELTLRDYLWGVVAAEMPASFHTEALKAQAVCARTYCLYQRTFAPDKHPQADVCGDYTCCQAYLTFQQAVEGWGEEGRRYADKIDQALDATDALVCLYEGAPIDALFFSSSAGRTLDAQAVWGSDVPYLTAVDSPEGEEVPGWHTLVTFTPQDFAARLTAAHPEADLSGPVGSWLGEVKTGDAGQVARLMLGGVSLTGAEVRTLFGLRSANFTLTLDDTAATFSVTGYGHGVGLSQYGANALAGEGKSFWDILTWYYTGITVGPLS